MKIGFVNVEYEKRIRDNFEFYVEMIRNSESGTKDFNFASEMLRNQLDFMRYNRECQPAEEIKPQVATL